MPILPPSAFAFCGPTYLGISPVIDAERSINLFPELEIGSRGWLRVLLFEASSG